MTTDRDDRPAAAPARAPRGPAGERRRGNPDNPPDAPATSVTTDLASTVLGELRAELDSAEAAGDTPACIRVHELLGGCLAARGEWMQAYLELRAAVDLSRRDAGSGEQERRLLAEVALLRRETAEARHASLTDPLTETFNRRFLDQALRSLTEQHAHDPDGTGVQTCVALIDLDLFKQVNDRFGHATGDQVLQRVAELLQDDLPPGAFCARYGGEEFVLVLPGSELAQTVALCERARDRIEHDDWSRLAADLRVTVSTGVACPRSSEAGGTGAQNQLLRADALLYAAKRSGRNAVAFREDAASPVRLAGAAGHRRVVHDVPVD